MLFEDKYVCMVVYILVFFNWMLFVVGTVNQISTALGIRCFVINPPYAGPQKATPKRRISPLKRLTSPKRRASPKKS